MQKQLQEVARQGAPAQRALAQHLLTQLSDGPAQTQVAATVDQLINAYLHDPDLTRNP